MSKNSVKQTVEQMKAWRQSVLGPTKPSKKKSPKKKNFKKKYNNAQRKILYIPYSISF